MKKFRDFESAREFVRKLKLKNKTEWNKYRNSGNKPNNIPSNPQRTYKNEWGGFSDFLGNGYVAPKDRIYLTFKETREFARSLNLKGQKEWMEYCDAGEKPENLPRNVWIYYKKEWISWGNFLGNDSVASRDRVFRPYHEAREFVGALKLKNAKEWRDYCNTGDKPDDIPSHPWDVYKEWKTK